MSARPGLLGHDVMMQAGAVRRRIALTGQFATVDDDLAGRENHRATLLSKGSSE